MSVELTPAEEAAVDRLYFGCWGSSAGHWLRTVDGRSLRFDHKTSRWPIINSAKIDGAFTPKSDRSHGAAKLWHSESWTILALHDYSRDSRPASNAAFLMRGAHDLDAILAMARESFGDQLARIEADGPIRVVERHTPGLDEEQRDG